MGSRRKRPSQRHTSTAQAVIRMPRGEGASQLAGAVDPFALPVRPPPLPSMPPHATFEDEPDTDEHLIATLAQREGLPEPTTPSGLQRVRQSSNKHPRVGLVTRQADDGSYEMVYANLDEDDEDHELTEAPPQVPLLRRPAVQIGALIAVILVVGLSITLAALLTGNDEPRQLKRAPVDKAAKGPDGPYEYVAPENHNNKLDLEDGDGEDDGEPNPRRAIPKPEPEPEPEPQDSPGDDLNGAAPDRIFRPSPPGLNINKPIPEIRSGAAPLIGERLQAAQDRAAELEEQAIEEELDEQAEGDDGEEEVAPIPSPPGDDERYLNGQNGDEENLAEPEDEEPVPEEEEPVP